MLYRDRLNGPFAEGMAHNRPWPDLINLHGTMCGVNHGLRWKALVDDDDVAALNGLGLVVQRLDRAEEHLS
jgi:hypothetical protein